MQSIFFTVCYIRDLGNAQLLGESLKKHHPTIPFVIFLADAIANIPANFKSEFTIESIDNETLKYLGAKYNWNELKDNCKPHIAEKLLAKYKQIIYLDCTSYLYQSLNVVLNNEASILLVPQLLFANKYPKENEALNEGIYHAGFFMLRQNDETLRFVSWWKEKVFEKGYEQVCKGMNKDRLILELVPVLFKGVFIEKNPAINVGKWNLAERNFEQKRDGNYFVGEQALISFNFKGSDYYYSEKKQLRLFHFLTKINPAFGLPVQEKNIFQKLFTPPLLQVINKIDVFFDRF